jgi:peptide/nickel transport system substrate-binding protein
MKRLRTVLAVATAAALAVGLASSSGAAPGSGSGAQQTISQVRIGLVPISTLDIARSNIAQVHYLAHLGLENLMRLDANGRPQPHLVESVRQRNPFAYEYTLRRGIRFWNGNELTAEDVAHSLNYYRFPASSTSAILGYPSVRDIKAVGRYNVRVTLKRRDALWPYTIATYGFIFEKKFQAEHGAAMGRPGVLTMGTGPWKFDSLDPTRGAELSANPRYWRGRVPIQRVSFKFFSGEQPQALALRAGELDLVPSVAGAAAFEAASDAKVTDVHSCGAFYFAMNTKKPPWDDVHIRRAAAHAIDKRGLITAAGVRAQPTPTFITPQSLRSLGSKSDVDKLLSSLPKYPFDLAKARAEIARSKYRNGVPATTIPAIGGLAFSTGIAEALSGMLAKVGIKAEVKALPFGQLVALGSGPKENIDTFASGNACVVADPGLYATPFFHSKSVRVGSVNRANYTNPAADTLIDAARQATHPAKRLSMYGQLLRIVARDVPYVPIYTSSSGYAVGRNFTFPGFHHFTLFTPGWLMGIKPR